MKKRVTYSALDRAAPAAGPVAVTLGPDRHGAVSADCRQPGLTALGGKVRSFSTFEFDLAPIPEPDKVAAAVFSFLMVGAQTNMMPNVAFTLDAYLSNGLVDAANHGATGTIVGENIIPARMLTTPTYVNTTIFDMRPIRQAVPGDHLTIRLYLDDPGALLMLGMGADQTQAIATLQLMCGAAPQLVLPGAGDLPLVWRQSGGRASRSFLEI